MFACLNPNPALQRIAVMWMQGREAAGSSAARQQAGGEAAAHPFIQAICCSELEANSAAAAFGEPAGPGLPLWLDTASGEVLTEPPPTLRSVRGGLFTDEPGLGKTITAVSWVRLMGWRMLAVAAACGKLRGGWQCCCCSEASSGGPATAA